MLCARSAIHITQFYFGSGGSAQLSLPSAFYIWDSSWKRKHSRQPNGNWFIQFGYHTFFAAKSYITHKYTRKHCNDDACVAAAVVAAAAAAITMTLLIQIVIIWRHLESLKQSVHLSILQMHSLSLLLSLSLSVFLFCSHSLLILFQ